MTETYIDEINLTQKETLETDDFIRVVGEDDNSYKQLLSDVAKVAIEDYEGSVLGGTAQSVQDAIDSASVSLSIADDYDASASYDVGEFCVYENQLYKCTTATTGEWDADDWTAVTVGDEIETIAETLETKADIDGDYPTLIAGNADHLLSDEKITDTAPYLFRRTGGGNTRIGYSCFPTIVGGSVVGNQLVNGSGLPTSRTWNGLTVTNNGDGSLTFAGTVQESNGLDLQFGTYPTVGHKVLLYSGVSGGSWGTYAPLYDYYNQTGVHYNAEASIINITNASMRLRTDLWAGQTINFTIRPQSIDLTAMLGSTIADRAYAKEQAQAGSGIAWLKSYGFISDSYEAYDTGTIKSVEATAHVTTGKNWLGGEPLADAIKEAIPQAVIDTANKTVSYASGYSSNTSFTDGLVFSENTQYTIIIGFSNTVARTNMIVRYTDGTTQIIPTTNTGRQTIIFTTSAGKTVSSIGGSNNDGTSVIYYDETGIFVGVLTASDFEPYTSHTYPLGNVTLRGIPKVDANDNIYYDGDTCESDGAVTRRFVEVDLGSLSWTYSESYGGFFSASLPSGKDGKYISTTYINGVCDAYLFIGTNTAGSALSNYPDKIIVLRSNDSTSGKSTRVFVKDSAYSDAVTFTSAMSGHYFVYELATPTTETTDPFTSPMLCDPSGTEEWVTDNGVPVGHQTEYNVNLKGKLEALPDLPTADGEYKLKVTVTGGVASYSWEAIE